MQLSWDEHFHHIVLPAWRAYLGAERKLSEAVCKQDETSVARARYDALREGAAACFFIHHYADLILRARPPWLPDEIADLKGLRIWLSKYCMMLRTNKSAEDVALLGDVADALKHAILTMRLHERDVSANDAVIIIGTGYGELAFGEGKYGGIEQVLVKAKSRTRALSCVVQNVIDAWCRAAGINLPDIHIAER